MKKLIIVNGTMGVGKSAVCEALLKRLTPGVYLDGDWCWKMNPFCVTEENKEMAVGNITHLLKSFLGNTGFEYIIFCWVMHEQEIFGQILGPLNGFTYELHKISLVCSEEALKKRLESDVKRGVRDRGVIDRSLERLPLYDKLDTLKIDVSRITAAQAAGRICGIVKNGEAENNPVY